MVIQTFPSFLWNITFLVKPHFWSHWFYSDVWSGNILPVFNENRKLCLERALALAPISSTCWLVNVPQPGTPMLFLSHILCGYVMHFCQAPILQCPLYDLCQPSLYCLCNLLGQLASTFCSLWYLSSFPLDGVDADHRQPGDWILCDRPLHLACSWHIMSSLGHNSFHNDYTCGKSTRMIAAPSCLSIPNLLQHQVPPFMEKCSLEGCHQCGCFHQAIPF